MKKFYGLTGTKLNIVVAIVAGIDFALFGYDQVSQLFISTHQSLTNSGRSGRSTYAEVLSEILSRY